ncbi:MAG: 16S rRNA (guanine(527)-N(7))-methyltransferase RsmG [Agathobacter sp.]|nr:16S rRNA (guanine(527)-N(7))-methyltransferase RsmG [Agathobacter sp.]
MNYNVEYFLDELGKLNISLSEMQINQFIRFYEMLIEKNKVMNLTAITEFDEVIDKHFLDSLNLFRLIDLNSEKRILDLGTGAGFPGIPLKIAFPKIKITLVDSLNKRVMFLNDVVNQLGLEDVECVHARAEDLAKKKEYREEYDICVSRAVANLSTLSEYCIPFVKVGGNFISYKSGDCDEEINSSKAAIKKLGARISKVENFEIKDMGRSFVVIDKISSTPNKYPRKAGLPSKEPLK